MLYNFTNDLTTFVIFSSRYNFNDIFELSLGYVGKRESSFDDCVIECVNMF